MYQRTPRACDPTTPDSLVATRRGLLVTAATCATLGPIPRAFARADAAAGDDFGARAEAIVAAIEEPRIPRRDFPVQATGGEDDSAAIAEALARCEDAGGGRIVLPQGVTRCGPIRLRSRMELHVPHGARLKFLPEPGRYLPPVFTRWEGVELMGNHPLIYAFEEEDVAVSGEGVIDGSADAAHWWPWKGLAADRAKGLPESEYQAADRARLFALAEAGTPVAQRVFGEGNRLRPPLFQPYRCTRVRIEGVTVVAAPFWQLHPVECRHVTVRGVTCSSHGPNNDGLDPESCDGVLIENCIFDTGDDCIAIKSGRNADGRRLARPCQDIVIRNCLMKDGHAGVALGSELTGGIRNVFVHDCRMDSPNLTRALFIKSNSYRGGRVEEVHVRRVTARTVENAFLQIWMLYEEGEGGGHVPHVAHVSARDCTVGTTGRVLVVRGLPEAPVEDLSLANITVAREESPSVTVDVEPIALDHVVVAGRTWTRDYLRSLPGADSIHCGIWAVCT
ncbi:glycoside hydrolase family 28 protein [Novosphingobium profundi]|uniref:glycoside hydrolase family 28 protein n=1 Tax=Novosphingobium profundi TaxID=1774954 RepID=UPI001BD956F2|nr:glycoside hydrolase family 28 protein [Novosphingobium profundi]MBT0669366.1 glycoside hydrolase family 28 protein [Novosphingobium profundi]